jgi:ABC-type polar amino acid transport system ATPase subunit
MIDQECSWVRRASRVEGHQPVDPAEVLVVCGERLGQALIRCINRPEPIQKGEARCGLRQSRLQTSMTKLRAEIGFVFQRFASIPTPAECDAAPMKVRKTAKGPQT